MKRIFLDTNVIVDFILERDGAEDAANILQLGEDGKVLLIACFKTKNFTQLYRVLTMQA